MHIKAFRATFSSIIYTVSFETVIYYYMAAYFKHFGSHSFHCQLIIINDKSYIYYY